mgnify:CR=1 FL=1
MVNIGYKVVALLLLGGFTLITFGVWNVFRTKTSTDVAPFSKYEYWNKLNTITLTEDIESSREKIYKDDKRKVFYICESLSKNTLFYADNEIVSYYKTIFTFF